MILPLGAAISAIGMVMLLPPKTMAASTLSTSNSLVAASRPACGRYSDPR